MTFAQMCLLYLHILPVLHVLETFETHTHNPTSLRGILDAFIRVI